jgi:hypothetical protein
MAYRMSDADYITWLFKMARAEAPHSKYGNRYLAFAMRTPMHDKEEG